MSDFIHFYIDTWDEAPEFDIILKNAPEDSKYKFLDGLFNTFGNVKWVEDNQIFVCQQFVDQAIFLHISCSVEWAKANCPEIFDDKYKERIVSKNELVNIRWKDLFFTPENKEYGYYFYDDDKDIVERIYNQNEI